MMHQNTTRVAAKFLCPYIQTASGAPSSGKFEYTRFLRTQLIRWALWPDWIGFGRHFLMNFATFSIDDYIFPLVFFWIMTRFELTDITASDEPWQRCQKCAWVWIFSLFCLEFICFIMTNGGLDGRILGVGKGLGWVGYTRTGL